MNPLRTFIKRFQSELEQYRKDNPPQDHRIVLWKYVKVYHERIVDAKHRYYPKSKKRKSR